ncbi:hypothetical protein E2320_012431, partial [Naja naja]
MASTAANREAEGGARQGRGGAGSSPGWQRREARPAGGQ